MTESEPFHRPSQPTPERHAEQLPPLYADYADTLIQRATAQSPEDTLERMSSLLESIASAAREGQFKSSEGKPYSEHEVMHQIFDLRRDTDNARGDVKKYNQAFGFVTNHDGLRAALYKLLGSTDTSTALHTAITQREFAAQQAERERAKSTDAVRDLGRQATEGLIEMPKWPQAPETSEAPLLSATEQLAKLTEGLSENDRLLLRSYADAVDSKKQAQQERDGQNSEYWGQISGQTYRELSARAQAIANTYASIYNRMN